MIFAEVASRVGLLGKVNLPRESRADGRREGRGEREKGWEKGRLCTAVGVHVEKSPGELKLRRCLSPFVPNLRSSKGSKADSDSLSPSPLLSCSLVSLARHAAEAKEGIRDKSKCLVPRVDIFHARWTRTWSRKIRPLRSARRIPGGEGGF